jgi:fructokinase
VICLGEALVDRLGPPGGDPAVDRPVTDCLGGAPANVACGLARLGTPVALIGRLGGDAIGAAFIRLLAQRGVDQRAVQHDPDRPTRVVLVRRSQAGERQFQGFAGDRGQGFADQALALSDLQRVWPSLVERAGWLLIGTIPLATPAAKTSLGWVVADARRRGVAIALDVNWRPTFWDASADPAEGPSPAACTAIRTLLEQAALIKLAREEALWLFDVDDPLAIQVALPQRPDVVVTDGAAPLRWNIAGEQGSLAVTPPPQLVDTTGAGDAFTAGLLHAWGQPVGERIQFAAACGALVCAGAGAIDPQPTHNDVAAFLGAIS